MGFLGLRGNVFCNRRSRQIWHKDICIFFDGVSLGIYGNAFNQLAANQQKHSTIRRTLRIRIRGRNLQRTYFEKKTVLSAWLGSWAIALGVFGQAEPNQFGENLIKLVIAMLVGVWYIVLFNQTFQKFMKQIIKRMNK